MLRRSPTMFGVLLSFAFFSGLLTLLLLAQRGIPDQGAVVPEPVPIDIGSAPIQGTLPKESPPQVGEEAPGPAVVGVPTGPVVPIIAPVGGVGPGGQEEKPGQGPGGGKPGEGPGGGGQPSPPGGGEQPVSPGGGQQPPGGGGGQQPSPPPAVLPPAGGIGDGDDDGDSDDSGDGDDDSGGTPGGNNEEGHDEDGDSGDDEGDN